MKERLNFNRWSSMCSKFFILIQHVCFKIIGLAPWTLNTSEIFDEDGKSSFKTFNVCSYSCAGNCFNILWFITSVSLNFNYLFLGNFDLIEPSVTKMGILRRHVLIFLSLLVIMIPIIVLVHQKLIISVYNRFGNVDRKLKLFSDCRIEFDLTVYLIFIFSFFVFGSLLLILVSNYSWLSMFNQITSCFITNGMITQFIINLNMISKRFDIINSTIMKYYHMKIRKNQAQNSPVVRILVSSELVPHDFDNIIFSYLELCEMCEDLQYFYGLSFLIIIFCFGIANLLYLYVIILSLLKALEVSSEIMQLNIILTSWTIFSLIALTLNVTKVIKKVYIFDTINLI